MEPNKADGLQHHTGAQWDALCLHGSVTFFKKKTYLYQPGPTLAASVSLDLLLEYSDGFFKE